MRAEFALFAAAIALSLVALLVAPRRITQAWRVPTALLVATGGALAPLLLYQLLDPSRAPGRALWEWSAAGGPTIQAAYRLDGLGTVGIAAGTAYVAAGLLAFYLARDRGKQSYNFPSPMAKSEHYDTIHRDTRGTPA